MNGTIGTAKQLPGWIDGGDSALRVDRSTMIVFSDVRGQVGLRSPRMMTRVSFWGSEQGLRKHGGKARYARRVSDGKLDKLLKSVWSAAAARTIVEAAFLWV